jgi:hypothetical protein
MNCAIDYGSLFNKPENRRDFRLQQQIKQDIRSSVMSRSVDW